MTVGAPESGATATSPTAVPFREAVRVWARIGLLSFGGPAGQIALMHRELIEKRRWIGEDQFLHALNYCMLLPGPEAQQLAIYIGWLMHRTRGGLAAGILFVLPGFLSILALSMLYAGFHDRPAIAALFFGLKAAVLAIVVEAVIRIGRRTLKNGLLLGVAALAFLAIFLFDVPFPIIVLGAGLFGFLGSRLRPHAFPAPARGQAEHGRRTVVDGMQARGELGHARPSPTRALRVVLTCVTLWIAPLIALAGLFGKRSVYLQEAAFFSKAAVVTFGGAYAVLAYIAQRAVETYGWLRPGEMVDGLGLAETTPGPLIMVVQFVGFLGAFRDPGPLPPMLAGVLGSLVTVWVTFVPCFLWIFLGAPYVEALRGNRRLHAALSAITAAIVGVILNLSIWFALHVVFREVTEVRFGIVHLLLPRWWTVDLAAAVLAGAAMVAMLRWKVSPPPVLAASALLGGLYTLLRVAGR